MKLGQKSSTGPSIHSLILAPGFLIMEPHPAQGAGGYFQLSHRVGGSLLMILKGDHTLSKIELRSSSCEVCTSTCCAISLTPPLILFDTRDLHRFCDIQESVLWILYFFCVLSDLMDSSIFSKRHVSTGKQIGEPGWFLIPVPSFNYLYNGEYV